MGGFGLDKMKAQRREDWAFFDLTIYNLVMWQI